METNGIKSTEQAQQEVDENNQMLYFENVIFRASRLRLPYHANTTCSIATADDGTKLEIYHTGENGYLTRNTVTVDITTSQQTFRRAHYQTNRLLKYGERQQ